MKITAAIGITLAGQNVMNANQELSALEMRHAFKS
jgi:hypothetical protein